MNRLKLLVVVLLLVAAGCANIPEQSNPQAVGTAEVQTPDNTLAKPPLDADPQTVVREFIGHITNADAARQYLSDDAKRTWQPDANPTIIEKTFNTFQPSVQEPNSDGTEQTVLIHGTEVGRLGADNAFYPMNNGAYDEKVTLRRQPDGQWRITKPPANIAVTMDEFQEAYREVRLYFFNSDLSVTVPDLRYVVQQPLEGLPSRVLQLLLDGPSDMLDGPLHSLLNVDTDTRTNVVSDPDGALVVNLSNVGDQPPDVREKIAAQIVLSLQGVATGEIRLLADGAPLVPGQDRWRLSDVPSYTEPTTPAPTLAGMFVSNGRLRSLANGGNIPGPCGQGAYQIHSAAQSIDGSQLAVVENVDGGVRLRVGKVDSPLDQVQLPATTMTRPTWQPGNFGGDPGKEVWTVVNGTTIVRVVRTKDGTWGASTVNSAVLTQYGTITDLRLSRDGTRVAMVADGHLVVAGVVRSADAVSIKLPRTLRQADLTDVVGVDWLDQYNLVVARSSATDSVLAVPFDGLQQEPYDMSNLNAPVRAVAAAPNRQVVVTDQVGMWTAAGLGEVWRQQNQNPGPDVLPFYPG